MLYTQKDTLPHCFFGNISGREDLLNSRNLKQFSTITKSEKTEDPVIYTTDYKTSNKSLYLIKEHEENLQMNKRNYEEKKGRNTKNRLGDNKESFTRLRDKQR